MTAILALFGFFFLPLAASAQTTIIGDALVAGRFGVGVSSPGARVDVLMSTANTTTFQVSGVDETPFLTVGSSGAVGVGITPTTQLDVMGSGDNGTIALQVRNGNLYPATSNNQITFGYNDTTNLRHAIRTYRSTTTANNGMDFLIWSPSVSTTAVGSLNVVSLVTASTFPIVHVMPSGTPDVELEVSNGLTTGGGKVHRALEQVPSSRAFKEDIVYFGDAERAQAYQDVLSLNHVHFRYMVRRKGILRRDKKQPLQRGLIYEEAPDSIKGANASISMDDRLTNAELALQEVERRVIAARKDAAALEGR